MSSITLFVSTCDDANSQPFTKGKKWCTGVCVMLFSPFHRGAAATTPPPRGCVPSHGIFPQHTTHIIIHRRRFQNDAQQASERRIDTHIYPPETNSVWFLAPSCPSRDRLPRRPHTALVYFNTRGAAEPIRLLLSVTGEAWEDLRYPMGVAAKGFQLAPEFLKDQEAGRFAINMGALPILFVRDETGGETPVGQSHAIARFIAHRHNMMGSTTLERAHIDGLYECVRDIKQKWFAVKGTPDEAASLPGQARREAKERWWSVELREQCIKLEAAAAAAAAAISTSPTAQLVMAPWLVGRVLSLADIAVYHLLSATQSLMTGSVVSFFDGEGQECVHEILSGCPRLAASVAAVGEQHAVRDWEERRPDTFT